MRQQSHAWVALRAFKLIEDSGKAPKLTELLSYYLSDVWEGAWLPDTLIVDMKYGHIFKMDSNKDILGTNLDKRFRISGSKLDELLTGNRLCLEYAKDSEILNVPYRTPLRNGGHLPNRVIALSHTIGDMLKLSDFPVAFYVKEMPPGQYRNDLSNQDIKALTFSPNFSARQIALMFFMLSHYVCDVHMPLHCDLRDYGKTPTRRIHKDLHPSIEDKWETYFPKKDDLILHDYLKRSVDEIVKVPSDSPIKIDRDSKYKLKSTISELKHDEWTEMVYIARTSYALSRKWIDAGCESCKDADSFIDVIGQDTFDEVTNCIFHDAVESVTRIWYKAWKRFVE